MLKAYNQDFAWKKHWDTIYFTPKEAMKYIRKLLRHFKLDANIYFNTYRNGHAYYRGYITLPKHTISLGMIAHEIGHLLAYKKGYRGHNKKSYKYIHRVYRYSIKYIPIYMLFKTDEERTLLTERI